MLIYFTLKHIILECFYSNLYILFWLLKYKYTPIK